MSCIKNLQFSPRELSSNVKRESACHKAKVVGWSAFLVMVAGSYLVTFSDLTFRATQLQNQALAGNLYFNNYVDYSDKVVNLNWRIARDILDNKDAKDLKYIERGWKSQVGEDPTDKVEVAWGPQGDPLDQLWYTQTERDTFESTTVLDPQQQIDRDSELYEQWTIMHDSSVVWFDTAACNLSELARHKIGYIGGANSPQFFPTASWFDNNEWFVSTNEKLEPIDDDGEINWNTNIAAAGSINVHDDFSMMKQSLDTLLDLADCDIDCQAKGSRLTLVAALNEASLTLLVINGLLGIWGGWSAIGRISQTYCTLLAFFFQLAILIACGTMLFTPYASTCYRSLMPTASTCYRSLMPTVSPIELWTMHDDYVMVVTLWSTQFIWVFIFAVIGLCGAVRSEKTDDQLPK